MFEELQTKQTNGQSMQADLMSGTASSVDRNSKGRGRLLVAEDALCMQRLISSILGKMNIEADMVENGQMACEMAQKSKVKGNPYDLILMDIKMPKMNGYEATRWLRNHGWEGPIVAVTALTTEEDRQECIKAGCDDHVSKPITEGALRNVVTRRWDVCEPMDGSRRVSPHARSIQ
jgi:ammonium transporter, Amt family